MQDIIILCFVPRYFDTAVSGAVLLIHTSTVTRYKHYFTVDHSSGHRISEWMEARKGLQIAGHGSAHAVPRVFVRPSDLQHYLPFNLCQWFSMGFDIVYLSFQICSHLYGEYLAGETCVWNLYELLHFLYNFLSHKPQIYENTVLTGIIL